MVNCPHCGLNVIHSGMCPRIAAVEYHENGTIKRVEYVQPLVASYTPWSKTGE